MRLENEKNYYYEVEEENKKSGRNNLKKENTSIDLLNCFLYLLFFYKIPSSPTFFLTLIILLEIISLSFSLVSLGFN